MRVATAQTQAHKQLTHPNAAINTINNYTAPPPRKSSRCAVFPLTPSPSPRPGARGAIQSGPARSYQVKTAQIARTRAAPLLPPAGEGEQVLVGWSDKSDYFHLLAISQVTFV